jgi:predicted DNA-binding protein
MLARLTVNVPADLSQRARTLAHWRGETVAKVVRTALERYIAEQERVPKAEPGPAYLREGSPAFDPVGLAQGRYSDEEVTEALNRIYRTEPSSLDPALLQTQMVAIGGETW